MASRACRSKPGGREFEREPTLREGYSLAEIFTRKTNTEIKSRQRRFLDGKPQHCKSEHQCDGRCCRRQCSDDALTTTSATATSGKRAAKEDDRACRMALANAPRP